MGDTDENTESFMLQIQQMLDEKRQELQSSSQDEHNPPNRGMLNTGCSDEMNEESSGDSANKPVVTKGNQEQKTDIPQSEKREVDVDDNTSQFLSQITSSFSNVDSQTKQLTDKRSSYTSQRDITDKHSITNSPPKATNSPETSSDPLTAQFLAQITSSFSSVDSQTKHSNVKRALDSSGSDITGTDKLPDNQAIPVSKIPAKESSSDSTTAQFLAQIAMSFSGESDFTNSDHEQAETKKRKRESKQSVLDDINTHATVSGDLNKMKRCKTEDEAPSHVSSTTASTSYTQSQSEQKEIFTDSSESLLCKQATKKEISKHNDNSDLSEQLDTTNQPIEQASITFNKTGGETTQFKASSVPVDENVMNRLTPSIETTPRNTETARNNTFETQKDDNGVVQHETVDSSDLEGHITGQPCFDFSVSPSEITCCRTVFQGKIDNHLRGCKWSPDGSCLLVNSNDNYMRLFNSPTELYSGQFSALPELEVALKVKESDLVYDYCWYPTMSSTDPSTCCFVTTTKDTPTHLWDAFTGDLMGTYRSYDQYDEIVAPHCVSFNPEGSKLFCGFNKMIRVFDIKSPGREYTNRPTYANKSGQTGIISCIAHDPAGSGLYAAGSYSRSVGLYYEPQGEMVCLFDGQVGGVTHLVFSPDGQRLYSGGRKDSEILCWDLRNLGQILYTMNRKVETNQRIYFDTDYSGKYLLSGNHNGTVSVWDLHQQPSASETDPILNPINTFQAHTDTVNGTSVHPSMPLIATTSGQRHFPGDFCSDSESEDDMDRADYSMRLWWACKR